MNKLSAVAAASLPVMVIIAILERFTAVFSTALVKQFCGDSYLQSACAVVGNQPPCCNTATYFMAALALLITIAMVVLLLTIGHARV